MNKFFTLLSLSALSLCAFAQQTDTQNLNEWANTEISEINAENTPATESTQHTNYKSRFLNVKYKTIR